MTPTHILSDEELAEFNTDEGRGKVRARIAENYLSNETVTILLPNLEPVDQIIGMIPAGDETEPAVILTEEEKVQLAAEKERLDEEVSRLEEVVRPEVMRKLQAEARHESREERRRLSNEVLELRAKLARLEAAEAREANHWKAKFLLLQAENTRLRRQLGQPESAAATDAKASEVEESSS